MNVADLSTKEEKTEQNARIFDAPGHPYRPTCPLSPQGKRKEEINRVTRDDPFAVAPSAHRIFFTGVRNDKKPLLFREGEGKSKKNDEDRGRCRESGA